MTFIPPLVPDTQSAGCTREDWNKALVATLKTKGLEIYLTEDFPDDDTHRDNIHTVKMFLITLSAKAARRATMGSDLTLL
jgi:hypothetical protein